MIELLASHKENLEKLKNMVIDEKEMPAVLIEQA